MPKKAPEMTALDVRRLHHSGGAGNDFVAVGGVPGLQLQILKTGAKSWILRVQIGGKRRHLGLGGFPEVSLSDARHAARLARDTIRQGRDPIVDRQLARQAALGQQRRALTFKEAVDRYLASKLQEFRNPKHQQQWRNTLDTYAIPILGKMPVDKIGMQDVLNVLQPIWSMKTETASRLRGRIESTLSWATVAGHRSGPNPAAWAGNLREMLPSLSKLKATRHHPAVQICDASRWLDGIRRMAGTGARALEFLALSACRSQEVRGARWDEIDIEAGVWTIPPERMKMRREHRVPLSSNAIDLLKKLPRLADNPLVFPATRGGQLSDMTLSAAMKRLHATDIANGGKGFFDERSKRPAVPHGLRSTFKDWVVEHTDYPNELSEMALAHRIESRVEAAYRRGDLLERRRSMMAAWSDFLDNL